jgi:PAS domain S-box-containing protein
MKLWNIKKYVFGTLRGRLVLGVAMVHAVMMTLFIIDLTARQRAMLLDRQIEEATALAQSLSTSAAIWIATNDISGLQEIVDIQLRYPELVFAILTDEQGLILAHTDQSKHGLYLLDLPSQTDKPVVVSSKEMIQVLAPAKLNNRQIGWAHVGLGRLSSGKKLAEITFGGILYALAAIVIGSFIAWWMGIWFTRRLYAVQNTIRDVRKGNPQARSKIEGTDEAASIASEFNVLLDTLATQHSLLLALINSSTDFVIFSLDKNYCYTAFNEKHRSEMKIVWNVDIAVGMNLLDCMHISHLKELAKESMDRVLNGESFTEVQHQPEPDIYYEFSWNPIFQSNEVVGITAFVRNITERKQYETQILKLNRIYSVLSNINQAIVRIHEPQEMMKEACRIAVEHGKFKLAWIGMANPETNKVDVTASFGETGDYLNKLNIDLSDPERNSGPTGTALITGVHKISNNILLDENMILWRRDALNYGYKSSASFPLIINEKVIGTFNLYSDEIGFFQEDDIKLLDEMAIDISFALEFIEAENKRKMAEVQLIESEARYQKAEAIGHVGNWEYNLQTTQFWGSDEAKRIYGFDQDSNDFSTTEVESCIPERERVHQALVDLIEKGKEYHLEFEIHPKNSKESRIILSVAELECDEFGNPLIVAGVIHDITQQKRAEAALRESEEKYRNLIQKIQAAVVVHGADTKIITCNVKAQELIGLSQNQLLGKTSIDPVWHFFREDHSVMPFEEYPVNLVMASQNVLRNYIVGVHHPNSDDDVWVLVNADPVFDRNNQLIQVIVTFTDITERKQTEARLAKTTDRLNEAQRIAHVGSWELDIVNNILIWSDEIYQIFEIDPKKFGASYEAFLEAIHPDDRNAVNNAYTNSLNTKTPYVIDHRLLFSDGRIKWVHEQCESFYDPVGKPVRSIGIVQDITERKKAEEEIQKLNMGLEQRVILRTAQLEAANKELEAFSYSVSHDLRAPLRSIDGFSQILLEEYQDKVDAQGKNYLQRIRVAAQRMAQLIDDMLNLSRVSRGEMNFQQVNLSEIAKDVADNIFGNQPERKVEFIIQEGITVWGDGRLLRIILENLIGNAWKFTSKHPTARIEFGVQQQKGIPVYFVRDDGAGFEMNYAQKLFGAFQRLHSTIEFSGTGIGLATVQRVVHRHGGKVWAEGEVEKGATFYFTIP